MNLLTPINVTAVLFMLTPIGILVLMLVYAPASLKNLGSFLLRIIVGLLMVPSFLIGLILSPVLTGFFAGQEQWGIWVDKITGPKTPTPKHTTAEIITQYRRCTEDMKSKVDASLSNPSPVDNFIKISTKS